MKLKRRFAMLCTLLLAYMMETTNNAGVASSYYCIMYLYYCVIGIITIVCLYNLKKIMIVIINKIFILIKLSMDNSRIIN